MAHPVQRALRVALGVALGVTLHTGAALAAEPDPNEPIRDQLIDFKDLPGLIKNPTFMTLRLDNADLREVIKLVAQRGGMNLIMDDSVKGRFTIDVRAMPLDELFMLTMRMNDLSARRMGTALLIAKQSTLREKIDATQAGNFRLNNALAEKAVAIIEKLLEEKGDKKASTLKLTHDARTNSIMAIGTAEEIAKVKAAVAALDKPAPQVVIEVKLVEVQSSLAKRLGGEFGFGGSKFGVSNGISNPATAGAGTPTGTSGGTAVTFSAMGNFTSNLNARINALVNEGDAKVLANPRVATQDNYEAEIKIVNKFPVVQVNFQGGGAAGGAALAAENVQFREIGETLKITPRIDTNGFVTMDLEPVISVRGKDVIVNRNPVPEINERSLKTRMRVADGETVVIGGLIRRNTNNSTSKMPILGDLPFIGFMFRLDDNSFTENEVLIMVTPHITMEKSNV